MKRLTLFFFEMLFFVVVANSQHLLIAPTIEKTIAGNQYGSQLSFETKGQWNVGGFYQTSWQQTTEGIKFINPFYGITINAPLAKSERINFYVNVRAGVVNQRFLVVAPELETKLIIHLQMQARTT